MKQINNLFLLLLILFICSCTTEDPDPPEPIEPMLPPITMRGENTFGFLLDGEVWLPKDDSSSNPFKNIFHSISYDNHSGTISLQVENIDTTQNWDQLIRIAAVFFEEGVYKTPPHLVVECLLILI